MIRRDWYTMNVGVQPPVWTDTEPVEVRPPGHTVTTVGSKAHRALSRAMEPLLQQPSIEPLPRGSSFVVDEAMLNARVAQGRALWRAMELSPHEWGPIEADQARKIVLQRGGAPGWWVQSDGLVVPDTTTMDAAFAVLGKHLGAMLRPPPDRVVTYKQNTSHGFPDYATSSLSFVMHACAARASEGFDELAELLTAMAGVMDQGDTPLSSIMYNRAGPLGKAVAAFDTSGSVALRVGTLQGLCCRRREVHGMSSAGNMWQKAFADDLKFLMYQDPSMYHPGGPPAIAAKLQRMGHIEGIWYSDDISSFDKNVRAQHQDEMITHIHGGLISSEWGSFKRRWKDMPLLGPPITQPSEAFLYEKLGGTPSGAIDTALDGTLINTARIITSLARCLHLSEQAVWDLRHITWDYICLGDDTVLRLPTSVDPSEYERHSTDLGYPCKTARYIVFLMHEYSPFTWDWSPLASRVFQQTVFNEYGGEAPSLELLAFTARATAQFWASNPWASTIDAVLTPNSPFTAYGVTARTASRALGNPRFVADLAAASRAQRAQRLLHRLHDAGDTVGPRVAAIAGQLLSHQQESSALGQTISRADARTAALRIAGFMALSEDDRPAKINLPDSVATEFNALL